MPFVLGVGSTRIMGAGADANGVDTPAAPNKAVDASATTTTQVETNEGAVASTAAPSATDDAEMRKLEEEADAETEALRAELAQ